MDKFAVYDKFIIAIKKRLQNNSDIIFPPKVFETFLGEIESFDVDKKYLIIKFPVLDKYMNPYNTLQGGVLTAMIDNTIGPLSMMIDLPSFTRQLNVKYIKPVPKGCYYILIKAKFIEKRKNFLFFDAIVEDNNGNKVATASVSHWIMKS